MSEQAPTHLETGPGVDFNKLNDEKLLTAGHETERLVVEGKPDIAEVRASVAETVAESKSVIVEEHGAPAEATPVQPVMSRQQIGRDLADITLTRTYNTVHRKQSAPIRTFSKLVHQPTMRVASEVAGKTVSRSSGILGGGVLAFVGSTGYLYLAKHLGFHYNFGVFLVLFTGGFMLGLSIELAVHLATANRHKTAQ